MPAPTKVTTVISWTPEQLRAVLKVLVAAKVEAINADDDKTQNDLMTPINQLIEAKNKYT